MPTRWQIVRKAAKWTAIGLLVLVLYALSLGPAFWLATHGYHQWDNADSVVRMYEPVVWIAHKIQAQDTLDAYVDWWMPSEWDKVGSAWWRARTHPRPPQLDR